MGIDYEKTAANLKALMLAHGLTVRDLAATLYIHPNAIYKWYQGKNIPNIDNLCILADLYGETVDSLLIRRGTKQ